MPDWDHSLPVPFLDRITTKLTIAAIVFVFVLAGAVAFQVEAGLRRNQYGAYSSSLGALQAQLEADLLRAVVDSARLLDARIHHDLSANGTQELLTDLVLEPGSRAFLINERGTRIAATSEQDSLPNQLRMAASSSEIPFLQKINLDGAEWIAATAPLANSGWRLVVLSPGEPIEARARQTANAVWGSAEPTIRATIWLVLAFFICGLAGMVWILERLFNRRIAALVQGVRAISAGDLAVSVPVSGQDELAILAQSFNQMAAELQRRQRALLGSEEKYRRLAQDLERRVEQTTREIKQLYEQSAARNQELEVLYQADEQLHRHLHLDDVLQALADVVVDELKADTTSVMIWDEQRQRLVIRGARGFSPETIERLNRYHVGDGVAGKVFQTGQVVAVEDAANAPPPANLISQSEGIRSLLSVPISIENRTFGVFGMNYRQPRRFTPDDIRLGQSLAQRAATAIENARLYEQVEQAATLEERQRLARELHDSITQSLYSLALLAEAGRRYAAAGNFPQVEHHLGRLGETAQQTLKEMRLLVYELRPPALARVGLVEAVRQRLDAVEKRAGVQGRVVVEGNSDLPPKVEEELYRIILEALNNALKHAHARSVTVSVRGSPGVLEVEIFDDGQGFDPQAAGGGIGMASMAERAVRLGGVLTVASTAEQGTRVRVRIGAEDPAPAAAKRE